MTNDDILHLALDYYGEDIRMTKSFTFYILIPNKSIIPMNISWTCQDKISIIDLKWDEIQLINYFLIIYEVNHIIKINHYLIYVFCWVKENYVLIP